jgi:hypothetical protein
VSSDDFAFEPVKGLPGLLPKGERILWRGRPDWRGLARGAYFGDWVAIYFAALVAWRVGDGIAAGAPAHELAIHAAWLALVGLVALAVIAAAAWASARATVYTITNRRVALRIGAALTVNVNVPFKQVAAAALRPTTGGRGDIALTIGGKDRFALLLLWPHCRPWRFARPEPMLRALPDARKAATVLAEALRTYQAEHGVNVTLAPASRPAPDNAAMPAGVVAAE